MLLGTVWALALRASEEASRYMRAELSKSRAVWHSLKTRACLDTPLDNSNLIVQHLLARLLCASRVLCYFSCLAVDLSLKDSIFKRYFMLLKSKNNNYVRCSRIALHSSVNVYGIILRPQTYNTKQR